MDANWQRNFRAVWLAEFIAILGFATTVPILPLYVKHLGVPEGEVNTWSGLIVAAPAFAMALMSPVWGALSDRLGRKLMVERAMFGGALFIGLMGWTHTVQQLAVLRLLQGALTGSVAAATTLVASTTPKERLGETLGQLQLAIFLGQSLGPVSGGLVADVLGYRAVFFVTAAWLLLAGLLVFFNVRETFTPHVRATDGLPLRARWQQTRRALFGASLLGLILALRFALRLGTRVASPLLPLLTQALLPPDTSWVSSAAGLLTTASGLSSAIAAPVLGRVADRYGGRRILLMSAFLGGLGLIGEGIAPSYAFLIACEVLIGISIGGTLSTLSAYIGRLAPPDYTGTAYGLDTTAVSMANTVGPMTGGWLADHTSLKLVFMVGGLMSWLAAPAVLLLPRDDRR